MKTAKSAVPLYNRFKASQVGRGGDRGAKFSSRFGSGTSYSDVIRRTTPLKSTPLIGVTKPHKGKRQYRQSMQAVTGTASATVHAAMNGAPLIAGGYNWCHLVGHGGGGSDSAANVVAGSTHANSEQLALESVLYNFKDSGVSIRSSAELFAAQVARVIVVQAYVRGRLIYTRRVDALRGTKPTFTELSRARRDLTEAITRELG